MSAFPTLAPESKTGEIKGSHLPELRQILDIPEAAMDHAMGFAYQLYVGGHHAQAAKLCQALIACDGRYWWPHSLLAAALRRLERFDEALVAVNLGLEHEPRQPKLLRMRDELQIIIGRRNAAAPYTGPDDRRTSHPPAFKLAAGY
jgi:Flp pilus assembly protein TadD